MKHKAVFFDLDNTLVNRKEAFAIYTDRFIDQFVYFANEEQRKEVADYIIQADQSGYRNKEELYAEIHRTLPLQDSSTTVEQLMSFWFAQFFQCTVLMQGAKETLKEIKEKGIKLGMITNGSSHSQNSKIDQAKLRDYFDVILISDEVNIKKPDKKIFQMALDKLGVPAELSWYVGDHPRNDIQGGHLAGMNTMWLQGFSNWEEGLPQPDVTLRHLSEIPSILDR